MPPDAVNPNVTRSRLVLEIASEMTGSAASDVVPTYIQPRVVLRHARGGKPATFLGVSTAEGIFAVASREVDLAIINPAAVLSVAMRGKGIFKEPMPVRAIAVIPSWDQFVFAVRPETGLSFLEDIARQKPKLRIVMRSTQDHTLHHMFDDVAAAAGFSRDDIRSWGGEVRKTGSVPWTSTETFKSLIRGDVDAIFDEAANYWVPQALDAGITFCSSQSRPLRRSKRWAIAAQYCRSRPIKSCRVMCYRWISAAGPFSSMPKRMMTW